MRTLLPTLLMALAAALNANATHVRGGEIRYTYVGSVPGGIQYEIQVDLFTDPAAPAENPSILVNIDGEIDTVGVSNIIYLPGICPDTQQNIYLTTHVFPGPGTYAISAELSNRHTGIQNIPNSMDAVIGLTAMLVIESSGPNSSPRFNLPQSELSFGWSWLLHDPQASDPDGDSLSFEPVIPLGTGLQPIAGYLSPEATTPPGDLTWVDPATGVFLWDQPNQMGYYQIAIKCTEWRNGLAIGDVTRDMMLCIGQLPTGVDQAIAPDDQWLVPEGGWGRYRLNTPWGGGQLTVQDARGRILVQGSAQGTIDLSGLRSGVYLVTLRTPDGDLRCTRVGLVH